MPAPGSAPFEAPRRRITVLFVVAAVLALVGAAPILPAGAQSSTTPGTSAPRPRLTTPVLSARRVPDLLRSRIADERIKKAIDDIADDAPATSCIEISAHGRLIYRRNADALLEPASNNKLLTAVGILNYAKPDDKIVTAAVAQAPPAGGVVKGNLWLVGGGDGMLTTPGYKTSFTEVGQTDVPFAQLADNIKAAGITEISGDIVGDDSRYDAERYVPSWPNRYKREDTVGPMSALIVNDGVTGYSKDPDKPAKVRLPGDPPVLAAETLKSYLEQRGVKITGTAVAGKAPSGTAEVARLETSIEDELTEMLSFSDNTTAELVNKEIGLRASGTGTTVAGTKATIAVLEKLGIDTRGLVVNDGSGLDDGNRLTCDLLNTLLDKQGPESGLAKGLSIWGQRGTLRKRTKGNGLEGKVLAKTGTLTNPPVASLAGFETTKSGDVLTFSFIQNGPKTDAGLQDKLALALLDYPQAPSTADLGPTSPSNP